MIDKILTLNPIIQALIAGLFTYGITILGASVVLFMKKINKTFLDSSLSLSAGIMIAASFFSLILPSIDMSKELKLIPWLIVLIGFISGGLLLFIGDKIYDMIELKLKKNKTKSLKDVLCL